MKKILFLVLILGTSVSAFCQSMQIGVVKEYNGAKKKTPLAGVELVVNNAGSQVSDRNGKFVLSFRTLKPGDKVELRKIEKNGYEIFNKEALEAWRIANDGSEFMIVLCKSSRFKALKDQYNAVASKSYAEQQKKDEEKLATLLKEGRIQQAEYEQKLQDMKHHYDEQLENLDNYIDHFARIDLETLSKEEQKIIEMVQAGKIEDAIAAYENMHLEEQYAKAVENIQIADQAISQLEQVKQNNQTAREETFDAIQRMNDARRLQGGEENFRKIGESLRMIAESDTSNFDVVYECAKFYNDQKMFREAIYYFERCISRAEDSPYLAISIYNSLGNIYSQAGNYEKAISCYNQVLALHQQYHKGEDEKHLDYLGPTLNGLALTYEIMQRLDDAIQTIKYAIKIYETVDSMLDDDSKKRLSLLYSNLGGIYQSIDSLNTAKHYMVRSVDILQDITSRDIDYYYTYANASLNVGVLCTQMQLDSEAVHSLNEAELYAKKCCEYNKDRYLDLLCFVYGAKGRVYQNTRLYQESIHYYQLCLDGYSSLYLVSPNMYRLPYAKNLRNMGNTYILLNDLDNAREKWSASLKLYYELRDVSDYFVDYANNVITILSTNVAEVFYEQKKADLGIDVLNKSLSIAGESYTSIYTLGKLYLLKEDYSAALNCWNKVLILNPNYLGTNSDDIILYEKLKKLKFI